MNRRQLMKTAAGAALLALSDGTQARGVVTEEALPSQVRGCVVSALNLAFPQSTHAEREKAPVGAMGAIVPLTKIHDGVLSNRCADIIERGWYKFVTQQETQDKIRDYFGYHCRFCGAELPEKAKHTEEGEHGKMVEVFTCPACGMPCLVPAGRPDRAGTALADILGFYLDPDRIDRMCMCVLRELPVTRYCPECKTGEVDFNLMDCTCRGCMRRWPEHRMPWKPEGDGSGPGSQVWYETLEKGPILHAALVLPVAPQLRHWFWGVKIVNWQAQWPGLAMDDTTDAKHLGMPV